MATVARENIDLLNDKIIVKINKEDYFPTFEKKLKEYGKTVNMPGFRKGMVPAGVIKKMYGPSIYTDEVLKTVEKQLYTYLDTEKPDIFAQPLALDADIRKLDHNNPSEYEFGFEIGLKPVFNIAPLPGANISFYKVKISDEMINDEVERMQLKGGKMTEPEVIDNQENVLNVLFTESDERGNAVENGIVKENSVILKYFTKSVQEQLLGKKINEGLLVQLSNSFEGDKVEIILEDLGFEKNDNAAADKYFMLTVAKIGLVEKRDLDEEFFGEVFPGAAVATEEEFRNKIKEEIQQHWDAQSRNQLHDQLYHYLLDETKMELPAAFLKRWLQTGSEQRKSVEQAEEEFPVFSNQLKWTLISDKIIKENNLQVSQDELKDYMKNDVMRYFGSMNLGEDTGWLDSYIEKMIKDEKQRDSSYQRLITTKLFNWVESQANAAEKEVSAEELTGMQHNHQH